jgi:O-antigen/teichoic acid export membrane protein
MLVQLIVLSKNNAIVAALSYFLTITLANHFGPEQFGIYSHALIAASIASIFINFCTDQTAAVLYSHSGEVGKVFNNIFFLRLALMGPTLGVIMFVYFDERVLMIFVFCLILANFNLAFLYEICHRNEKYSYIYLFERVAYIGLAFLLIHLKWLLLPNLFSLLFVVTAVSISYQFIDNKRILRFDRATLPSQIYQTLKENFPLVIVAVSTYAYGGFSRLILDGQLGKEMLGIYSAGWQLVTVGTIFQAQISRLWRTQISDCIRSLDLNALYRVIHFYILLSTLPILLMCCVFVFLSDYIISLLFTSSYAELTGVLPILGAYLLVINIAGLVDMLWVALKRSSIYMLVNVIFSALLLGFFWLFASKMNMFEFVVTTVFSHFISTVALAILWVRVFKLHLIGARAKGYK